MTTFYTTWNSLHFHYTTIYGVTKYKRVHMGIQTLYVDPYIFTNYFLLSSWEWTDPLLTDDLISACTKLLVSNPSQVVQTRT